MKAKKQSKRLKQPFGHNGRTRRDHSIDIEYLTGWLESLIHDEEENVGDSRGPKAARLAVAQGALVLLYEVLER